MIKGNVKIDRKNLISILQSCLVLILVIFVALMMVEIGNLKGTARVINYAGLVRGDTQRAVKLEITGTFWFRATFFTSSMFPASRLSVGR